jgi:tRNA G18 (ribose-2'-O)-methylase SpoU
LGAGKLSDLNATLKDGATTVLWGENIQDPGNLGTMIRSALAFGVDALVLTSSVTHLIPKLYAALWVDCLTCLFASVR